jgi:hypothetical protein
MFCSRTPERKKNSRRATRKRLLKKGLCKRESVFFILVFFHAKEIDACHPPPKFFNPPVKQGIRKRASPPSQKGHRPPRVFSSVPDQKSLRFEPRSFFTERYSINAGEAPILADPPKKLFFSSTRSGPPRADFFIG